MRDNDLVADSLGKNLLSLRTAMLVLGGALAGLSGAILVGFITLWAPSAWGYAETIVLFAAVIIGGAGNHRGAVLCDPVIVMAEGSVLATGTMAALRARSEVVEAYLVG